MANSSLGEGAKLFKRFTCLFLVIVAIFASSSLPGKVSHGQSTALVKLVLTNQQQITPRSVYVIGFIMRKLAHLTEFIVLAIALAFALNLDQWNSLGCINDLIKKMFVIFLSGLFLASSDEFYQLLVPGRIFDINDVYIDATGVVLGLLITSHRAKKLR